MEDDPVRLAIAVRAAATKARWSAGFQCSGTGMPFRRTSAAMPDRHSMGTLSGVTCRVSSRCST